MGPSRLPLETFSQIIFVIRGIRVVLDRDLAELYDVPTKALNQAVKRNRERFPAGFMFQLSRREVGQLVTICDRFNALKHSNVAPYAFTEYGSDLMVRTRESIRFLTPLIS